MSSFPRLLAVFVFVFSLLFFSCASNDPEVNSADCKIIFDYREPGAAPDVRLSVFMNMRSNVRLGDNFRILNKESGLSWTCGKEDLKKIDAGEAYRWVGCTKFSPARKSVFPKGLYNVYFEDKAERDDESSFRLNYPDILVTAVAEDFPEVLNVAAVKKIALYSNEDILLYFGEQPKHWNSNEKIFADYKNAWSTRECYCMNGNSILCLMPPVELGNKDFVKESEEN